MRLGIVLTASPGSASFEEVYKTASHAIDAGDSVSVFVDADGLQSVHDNDTAQGPNLLALQDRGATVMLCSHCLHESGRDFDSLARTGDLDELSRLIASADRLISPDHPERPLVGVSKGSATSRSGEPAMQARRILLNVASGPTGHEPEPALEGLRAAVSLASATERHSVTVLMTDGGTHLLARPGTSEAGAMLTSLVALGATCYISRSTLAFHGLDEPTLRARATVTEDETATALLAEAEVILTY